MKRYAILLSLVIVLCAAITGSLLWQGFNKMSSPSLGVSSSSLSVAPRSSSSASDISAAIDNTGMGLSVPDGMRMDIFASNLSGARSIVQDGFGNFWVSRPSAGIVTQLEMASGSVVRANDIFRGLTRPHGLALDPENGMTLYIAEETSIKRALLYSDAPVETIATLPAGGRHFTRSIGFGPDERLYVSIGSTCDVCIENNELHGTIMSMNTDGSDQKIVAKGLRNAVFFTWHPVDGSLWATEMGRDQLGNNLPPDEVNIIDATNSSVSDYGWPFCYGEQVRDMKFQPTTDVDCAATVPAHLMLGAHVAPLGLAFIPEEGWPEEYWYDLLVAEHGSSQSSAIKGYRIVRIPLDAQGNQEGEPVDFITGFHDGSSALGRPVDVFIQRGGVMYVTDDKRGAVYKVSMQELKTNN